MRREAQPVRPVKAKAVRTAAKEKARIMKRLPQVRTCLWLRSLARRRPKSTV